MRLLSFHDFPFAEFELLPIECGERIHAESRSSYRSLGDAAVAVVQPRSGLDDGFCSFHLVADVDDVAADDCFFEFLGALRLITTLPFHVVASFALDEHGFKHLRLYHTRTRCNAVGVSHQDGYATKVHISGDELRRAGLLRQALVGVLSDTRQAKLASAWVAFSQVGLGSVSAYQPALVSLVGALDVLTGGQCNENQLADRVGRILEDRSCALRDFLKQCCAQRGRLAHGKPVESVQDWESLESRGVSLTKLYGTVRRVIVCLLAQDDEVRREFLALSGPRWGAFESNRAPLQ